MQACFIASAGKHPLETHKAEAGRLSSQASREVFLQASPRRWQFQGEASVRWDDNGITRLATGRGKEEEPKQMKKEMRSVIHGAILTPLY